LVVSATEWMLSASIQLAPVTAKATNLAAAMPRFRSQSRQHRRRSFGHAHRSLAHAGMCPTTRCHGVLVIITNPVSTSGPYR
jgi:hypothetical protein